jgi:glycosyltransferase involved in cell wall biosynthesis
MITKRESALCYEATPNQCAACFDDIPASDFFLRKLYIQRFFELVDHFIAPSQFLAERYIAWGIARERMSVIENAIPAPKRRPRPAAGIQTGKVLRVGFFGQISSLKGINVLFEAAAILLDAKQNGIVFEIHGDYRNQPPDLQEDFLRRLAKAGRNVKFHGPYDERRVDALMQTVDLILVPSIWWENSPVVIQEALRNRRLVVCSDIGGMAEKIRDGVDGFHFPVGNSTALAALLRQLAKMQPKLMKLQSTMASPPSMDYVVNRHTELYGTLISQN